MGRIVDDSDLRRAMEELRALERRLNETQRIAHVAWWQRDFTTNEVALSEEGCRMFGVEPFALSRWHGRWLELIHPDDRAKTAEALAAAREPGGPRYDVEYRVVRPDGVERIVHSRGDVIFDESGRPARQFGVMQDITELRRTECELRDSEARFRTFVDNATDAFFLHDHQLTILDVNRQACVSLGYAREELIGMHPRDFDVGLDEAGIQNLRQRISARGTATFETRHRRKDGTVFPVEIRVVQLEQDGRRHLALARDITERKQAEQALREMQEQLRRLVDSHIIGIETWDADGRIIDANDAYLRILGYSREDLVSGQLRWPDLTPPESIDISFARWEEVKRTGVARPHRKEYFRKDGSRVPLLIGGTLLDEGRGVSFVLDLTEQKRAEEALREAQMQLAHANRLETMGQLTASIAHEVNQPIAATLTNAEVALRWLQADEPDLGEVQDALRRIVRDAGRAGNVVASIRALIKKAPPASEPVDLNAVILEVLELARSETMKNEVSVRTGLPAGLPLVRGDRVALQQVVLNLIVNAVEAMSGGDAPRALVLRTERMKVGEVLVAVADSGPGLAPSIQENLFNAFATTKPNGLGLGLSICRSIVEAHGGRLWASANAPRGAVFQFTLPIAAKAAS